MKTILIAGASGFVGQALVKKMLAHQYQVISLTSSECDLATPQSIAYLVKYKADFIFHVAGKIGVMESWQTPALFYHTHINTTLHLLEYARMTKTPLHYVSAYIYGTQAQLPIEESALSSFNNPYAHSKWMSEELCRFYHKNFQVPITISRPFNIYGPRQPSGLFLSKVIEQLKSCENVEVESLVPKRDYIYIEDVVEALLAIMQKGRDGETYNIGTGISHSCEEVIDLLQKMIKTNKPVHVKNILRPAEVLETRADISKIFSDTSWQPKYSFREGLRCMLD